MSDATPYNDRLVPEETPDEEPFEVAVKRALLAHQGGDAEGFQEFMQLSRRRVYSYLIRCGLDRATADDLFQEVTLALFYNVQKFDRRRAATPWIFTVAANKVRSHFRSCGRGPLSVVSEQFDERLLHHLETKETAHFVQQILIEIPEAQRQALLLSQVEGLSYQEIAPILGCSVGGVKTLVHRARQSLGDALSTRRAVEKRELES